MGVYSKCGMSGREKYPDTQHTDTSEHLCNEIGGDIRTSSHLPYGLHIQCMNLTFDLMADGDNYTSCITAHLVRADGPQSFKDLAYLVLRRFPHLLA